MKKHLILLVVLFAVACKKEGLTKDTGNLEIQLEGMTVIDGYEIYTEEQYNRFVNYQWPFTPYRSGGYAVNKIVEKGLPEGSYGIFMWHDGNSHQELFYISGNKVNRFSMP